MDATAQKRLDAARSIFEHLAAALDANFSVRLWDGSTVPLGREVDPDFAIRIGGPGVLGSLLRRPTLDNLMRLYASGRLDVEGGDLIGFAELTRQRRLRLKARDVNKGLLLRRAVPLLLTPAGKAGLDHAYGDDETGRRQDRRDEQAFIQFHYDVGNDFYALFLDPEMVYSCGYFTDWSNDIARAQRDKLEMICRKLRLKPGERFLDIGTDMTQDQPVAFFDWITHDKGTGRKLVEFGEIKNPPGFQRLGEFPNLTAALERRGWPAARIERVLGGNWYRLFREVWGA